MSRIERYWLTPPELEKYRADRFDPCPYPRPDGYDALTATWEKPWYCNPPFDNYTKFVKKAIAEGNGYLVGPIPDAIAYLLQSGARFVEADRYRWLEVDTRAPMPKPSRAAVWWIA
jgi:hypothetical protein